MIAVDDFETEKKLNQVNKQYSVTDMKSTSHYLGRFEQIFL